MPTRLAPRPAEVPEVGVAEGDVPGTGEGGEIPVPMEIPDPMIRRMPITGKEIEKYGYTEGCTGCEAKRRGEVARRGHSEKCRKRIEE